MQSTNSFDEFMADKDEDGDMITVRSDDEMVVMLSSVSIFRKDNINDDKNDE